MPHRKQGPLERLQEIHNRAIDTTPGDEASRDTARRLYWDQAAKFGKQGLKVAAANDTAEDESDRLRDYIATLEEDNDLLLEAKEDYLKEIERLNKQLDLLNNRPADMHDDYERDRASLNELIARQRRELCLRRDDCSPARNAEYQKATERTGKKQKR